MDNTMRGIGTQVRTSEIQEPSHSAPDLGAGTKPSEAREPK
jgi:hypothetical protein